MRMKALAAYLFIHFMPASARARKRGSAQDGTKFNCALRQRTPAIHPIIVPVSRIQFSADRACNYVSELALGQSARRVGVATGS